MLHISNKGPAQLQDIGAIFTLDITNRNEVTQKQNEAKLADAQKRQADRDAQELKRLQASTDQNNRTIDSLNSQINTAKSQIQGLNARLNQPRSQVLENSNNLDPSYDNAKVLFLSLNSPNNVYFALDTGHGEGLTCPALDKLANNRNIEKMMKRLGHTTSRLTIIGNGYG
jgi:DNA repair exonuclease SbcCD ATPase subunit